MVWEITLGQLIVAGCTLLLGFICFCGIWYFDGTLRETNSLMSRMIAAMFEIVGVAREMRDTNIAFARDYYKRRHGHDEKTGGKLE